MRAELAEMTSQREGQAQARQRMVLTLVKQDKEIDTLKAERDALQAKLDALPGIEKIYKWAKFVRLMDNPTCTRHKDATDWLQITTEPMTKETP